MHAPIDQHVGDPIATRATILVIAIDMMNMQESAKAHLRMQ